MTKNYLTYPCKVMKITQSYLGTTSHLPHTTGAPKDFPIDEACADTGRDWFYCPCDEMKVFKIYGVGSGGTNTLWLESTSKVYFADGTKDYVSCQITHPNDDDLKKLKAGQKFKRGDKICREGSDGATGNHLHISFGKGKVSGNGWTKNSKSKWVLTTKNGAFRPEQLCFVDKTFTKILSTKGLTFCELPPDYTKGDYKVTKASLLRVRTGAGTNYRAKSFDELSKNAKTKILKLNKTEANGYVIGLTFTVSKVKENWGKTPSGWVCLDFCEKV